MDAERYNKIDRIVQAAVELPPEERAAYLDTACGSDQELRREVESLVGHQQEASSFLEEPAFKHLAELIAVNRGESIEGRTIGNYRVERKIGEGGMGEVYLAHDSKLDRKVAIKILPEELTGSEDRLRRFIKEAKAASAFNHPNIITIHEIGEDEAGCFIVMELVDGQTLRAVPKPCLVNALINIGSQTAKALAATHAAGITHRDIKPDNIMLREDGYVKVLDFGLARLTPPASTGSEIVTLSHNTKPGVLLGTLPYLSPEQARGETATPASDIFALGVVFYELATGQHPFKADSMMGILHAITSQSLLPPSRSNPAIPAALDALILWMLEKETGNRPTAVEVDKALAELASNSSGAQLRRPARSTIERRTVGRAKEREELREGFKAAVAGRRQVICVAGEPGIGKTTLVEDFLAELSAEGLCRIARGRCSERLAGTEAYLPLIEALETLLANGGSTATAHVLRQIAPTWYAQVAPLSGDDESDRLLAEVRAASQERMKRELCAFLQEVSRLRPLVLFFDDLHWADVSTIDVLSFLAGKFDALNTLIVVAYRPSDMLLQKHGFLQIKPDLQARGLCHELQLEFLNEAEVADYLVLEFPDNNFPAELSRLIHAKTEGSPLFMVDLFRYLRDRNVISQESGQWRLEQTLPEIERELPESIRGMIERKISQLGEEDRKLLVAASVQGYEFDSAVVARVLNIEPDEVEERLEKLERVYAFVKIVSESEFPNRSLTLRYRFVHVLYQNALYGSLRATRRASLSAAVAQAIEGFHGKQRASVANELAVLWEMAREYEKAAGYFRMAAEQAGQVFAIQETQALARRGLAMIERLAESRSRDEQEIALRIVLGSTQIATHGYSSPEAESTYARARELCQRLGETSPLFPVLYGLCAIHLMRSEIGRTLELSDEFVAAAQAARDPSLIKVHHLMSISYLSMGELAKARDRLELALSLYDPELHRSLTWLFGDEIGTGVHFHLAWTLWLLGYPEQALAHSRESLRLSRKVTHAHTHAFALFGAACIHQLLREPRRVSELTDEMLIICAEHGLSLWLSCGTCLRGWVLAGRGEAAGGMAEMRRGLDAFRALGAELLSRYFLCHLAEAHCRAGQVKEGLAALDEAQALAGKNEDRFMDAELHRVRGELMLLDGAEAEEVETCFQQAIELTRRQQAKSFELRAVMSLARLRRRQGKSAEARQMLADIYGWFTEGFDTPDLKQAKALLAELKAPDQEL